MKILVVDDNVDAASTLAAVLSLEKQHDILLAYDGPSALTLAVTHKPSLVFLDIGMPRMDGYELAERLRQAPSGKPIYIVAVTGYGSDKDKARSRAAGIDEHLMKPADIHAILACLETARRRGSPN